MRLFLVVTAIVLASCDTGRLSDPHPSLAVHFPAISVYGPYAHVLTVTDLRQIRDLVRARTEMKQPLNFISVESTDRIEIHSGNEPRAYKDYFYTTCLAHKKNDVWSIDPGSIKKQEVHVSTGDEPRTVDTIVTD